MTQKLSPEGTSKSYVQKRCSKKVFKSYVQNLRLEVTPKVNPKSNVQKVCSKVTFKSDIQKERPKEMSKVTLKVTSKIDVLK